PANDGRGSGPAGAGTVRGRGAPVRGARLFRGHRPVGRRLSRQLPALYGTRPVRHAARRRDRPARAFRGRGRRLRDRRPSHPLPCAGAARRCPAGRKPRRRGARRQCRHSSDSQARGPIADRCHRDRGAGGAGRPPAPPACRVDRPFPQPRPPGGRYAV
ncbi:hypothetical protein LTR94_031233, partial [Friedmanniomyces endolithicus]